MRSNFGVHFLLPVLMSMSSVCSMKKRLSGSEMISNLMRWPELGLFRNSSNLCHRISIIFACLRSTLSDLGLSLGLFLESFMFWSSRPAKFWYRLLRQSADAFASQLSLRTTL